MDLWLSVDRCDEITEEQWKQKNLSYLAKNDPVEFQKVMAKRRKQWKQKN